MNRKSGPLKQVFVEALPRSVQGLVKYRALLLGSPIIGLRGEGINGAVLESGKSTLVWKNYLVLN